MVKCQLLSRALGLVNCAKMGSSDQPRGYVRKRVILCWGEIGSDRPTSVRTKQGDKQTVLIYERNTTGFGSGER
jgi:hypothetical protein